MSTRLYYTDSYRQTFDAVVVACEAGARGFRVRLDQTAFYPTSGGQPFDTGVLGDVVVADVIDADDSSIVHVVDRPLVPGASVRGVVDWDRRFEHMQQHTGQHVLSAAFDRLHGVRTEGFHLGAESATIDLAREVTTKEIAAAEAEANRVVWANLLVTIRFASAEEAAGLPLRKESMRTGPLRLVDVEDFDLSACGGTHVSRTGGIGIIAVAGWEKVRGATRLEFLCGVRALNRFHDWGDALAASTRHLSVTPAELAGGIERLQLENKALQRAVRTSQAQLAVFEARAMLARGVRLGGRTVVVEALDGWDAAGLKALATAVAAEPGAVVALFSAAAPASVVVARAPDADIDASAVLKALVLQFGGKGGGKADMAQGGGLQATSADLVVAATALLGAGA